MCRKYWEQRLEECTRNKYESHNRLLSKENEKILDHIKGREIEQITTRKIEEELDKALRKDTRNTYVYRLMKRNWWRKKMPRFGNPNSFDLNFSIRHLFADTK